MVSHPALVHLTTIEPSSISTCVTWEVQHICRPVGHLGAECIRCPLAYVVGCISLVPIVIGSCSGEVGEAGEASWLVSRLQLSMLLMEIRGNRTEDSGFSGNSSKSVVLVDSYVWNKIRYNLRCTKGKGRSCAPLRCPTLSSFSSFWLGLLPVNCSRPSSALPPQNTLLEVVMVSVS